MSATTDPAKIHNERLKTIVVICNAYAVGLALLVVRQLGSPIEAVAVALVLPANSVAA